MSVINQVRPSSESVSQKTFLNKGRDKTTGFQGKFAGLLENKNKINAMTSIENINGDKSKGIPLDPAERARANNIAKAEMDMKRAAALNSLSQIEGGSNLLDSARGALNTRALRAMGNFDLRPLDKSDRVTADPGGARKSNAEQTGNTRRSRRSGNAGQSARGVDSASGEGIGKLAAQFESGSDGIAAIGYDRHGGTSYGKYQVASRVGSMDRFLDFLDSNAPDISKTLREAGPANTGSRHGAMPDAWRKIAAEQPERFEALQERFIHDSHYKPALDAMLQNSSIKNSKISSAMQEVIWSTSVQHGPAGAARIFSRAADMLGNNQNEKELIEKVYAIRADQFGSSTEEVRAAVRNRLVKEKNLAINMLGGNKNTA